MLGERTNSMSGGCVTFTANQKHSKCNVIRAEAPGLSQPIRKDVYTMTSRHVRGTSRHVRGTSRHVRGPSSSRQRNVIVIQPIINTELTPRSLAAEAGGGFWPICLAVDSGHSDTHPRIWRGFWWVRKPGIKMRKTGHACRVCAYAHIFINNSKTNKDRTLRLHMHEAMIYIY